MEEAGLIIWSGEGPVNVAAATPDGFDVRAQPRAAGLEQASVEPAGDDVVVRRGGVTADSSF
ncbi:hypothetical protein Ae168Ps1_6208c [Pseudonocardia sp. Ae168_Ps1]|nr:hypothetical protein Ae168Ps1_6208c [Pseudonocardia sp. Ae168_Ps1]OLL71580.1 hypothetical protein Ae263Ps1_6068c [Pseudonocardia sp. Ae263_Ps1]